MTETGKFRWHIAPCDSRLADHVPKRLCHSYDTDQSATVAYRFNRVGFRGEDYNPQAQIRLCVIGEGNGFGVGLTEEWIFASRVADHLSDALGVTREAINVINLSIAGASSDYVTRMLLRQMPAMDVDLILLAYPPAPRMEYFNGTEFLQMDLAKTQSQPEELLPPPLRGYRDLMTLPMAQIALLKNMLLAQRVLEQAQIPYVIASEFLQPELGELPYLAPIFAQLDPQWILRHRCFELKFDLAADGVHGGAAAHGALAVAMLPMIAAQFERYGVKAAGSQIRAYHEDIKPIDPDWQAMRDAVYWATAGQTE